MANQITVVQQISAMNLRFDSKLFDICAVNCVRSCYLRREHFTVMRDLVLISRTKNQASTKSFRHNFIFYSKWARSELLKLYLNHYFYGEKPILKKKILKNHFKRKCELYVYVMSSNVFFKINIIPTIDRNKRMMTSFQFDRCFFLLDFKKSS